jgi:hypothetical protein
MRYQTVARQLAGFCVFIKMRASDLGSVPIIIRRSTFAACRQGYSIFIVLMSNQLPAVSDNEK